MKGSVSDSFAVPGEPAAWFERCADALRAAGFKDVIAHQAELRVSASLKQLVGTIWGDISVTLHPEGPNTRISSVATAKTDNVYALRKHPGEKMIERFKEALAPIPPLDERPSDAHVSREAPIRIVISYRREDDTPSDARSLYHLLGDRFGKENVFLDIDTIPPGTDWMEEISKTIRSCDVLLPLIGRHWLTVVGEDGRPRLEDDEDVLRFEIESALSAGIRIIPLQFHGAELPSRDELPESLRRLTRYQSIRIDNDDWDHDVEKLLEALTTLQADKVSR